MKEHHQRRAAAAVPAAKIEAIVRRHGGPRVTPPTEG